MLNPEDCRPGVQVICINNDTGNGALPSAFSEWVKVGHIYTIREVLHNFNKKLAIRVHEIKGKQVSIPGCDTTGEACLEAFRFKLVDPKALDIFRNCVKNITPKQRENYLEELKELNSENY